MNTVLAATGVGGGNLHTAVVVAGFLVAWGMVLAIGFLVWKTGSAKVWQNNFEGMKESRDEEVRKRDEVQKKLDDLITEHKTSLVLIGDLKKINERLEALPNLQKVIEFMAQERKKSDDSWREYSKGIATGIVEGIQEEVDLHEQKAIERHREIMREVKKGET